MAQTHDNHKEDCLDDSRAVDDTEGIFNKNNKGILIYGTHKAQESEGREADLHKHVVNCSKNPDHKKFVPVNDFNIDHLPEGYYDYEIFEYIKATADLTVMLGVKMTSTERPIFWPKTKKQYPFNDKRGSDVMRLGTGMERYVNKLTEEDIRDYSKGTCPCLKCQHSDTPSKVWGQVIVYTASHVVFDDLEARHTTCRLFYDKQDSPMVILNGWKVNEANIEEDWCWLSCVTCDIDLLDKLDEMARHRYELWMKVNTNYTRSRDRKKLTFIVSHPHGCPKHLSVGHWINRYKGSVYKSKYKYTTCTCPGSSGAYVHTLKYYDSWLFYGRHVYSGFNSDGINFSGTVWNFF